MNWSKEFSSTEIFFITFFVMIYLYYFYRVFYVSRKLNSSFSSIAIKFFLRSAYLTLMIFALLGPNFGITETEARSSAKDIYLAFDLSESMNATDVEPSRLDRAKSEAIGILNVFPSDKIGLIVFDSDAYIYTPLTYDHNILKNNILGLKTNILKSGGTNYNNLFSLIYDKFNIIDLASEQARVAVVISDGENFETVENNWYKLFKNLKINLLFWGVGSSAGSKIPKLNGFKKDSEGNEVITTLDVKQIDELSKKFNSKYYILNNKSNQLKELTESIMVVQNAGENLSQQMVTYNKYFYFLILALILISIDFLFNVNVLKL